MHHWSVQHAKARFGQLVDACLTAGPQVVSRRGAETAVLLSIEEWHRLQANARPSLKDLLLSDSARTETLAPERGMAHARQAVELE